MSIAILSILLLSLTCSVHIINGQAQTQPTVSLEPKSVIATQFNQTFTLNITISNVENLWGWALNITWDGNYLRYMSAKEGDFLSSDYDTQFLAVPNIQIKDNYGNPEHSKSTLLMDAITDVDSNKLEDSVNGNGALGKHNLPSTKTNTLNFDSCTYPAACWACIYESSTWHASPSNNSCLVQFYSNDVFRDFWSSIF